MQSEMEFTLKTHTQQMIGLLKWKKPITNKWVYKAKIKTNGEMEKLKAWLEAHNMDWTMRIHSHLLWSGAWSNQ